MKVCHVTSVHESDDGRILYKECASLAKAGYETYLVVKGNSRMDCGVNIVGVGEVPESRLKRMLTFSRTVYEKALELDAEIYHLHDPELLPYALKLKKLGKIVVFDSHERYTDLIRIKYYLPTWLRSTVAFLYEKYENYIFSRLDAVIFPCTYKGKHPFEGKCKRVETIDNFPLLEELYGRHDPSLEKKANSICHVGSLTFERGIKHLVEAMEKIDGELFLAGPFSPCEFQDELKQMPGWNKVHYLGILDRDQILQLLQTCQVGTATILNVGQYNKYDNLATKVYEYMAMGIPTLLSKAPYNEQVNERYRFGLCVDPENADELAAAINYLFDNPDQAKQMGFNGRKAVLQEFNWGTQERKLVALYREL